MPSSSRASRRRASSSSSPLSTCPPNGPHASGKTRTHGARCTSDSEPSLTTNPTTTTAGAPLTARDSSEREGPMAAPARARSRAAPGAGALGDGRGRRMDAGTCAGESSRSPSRPAGSLDGQRRWRRPAATTPRRGPSAASSPAPHHRDDRAAEAPSRGGRYSVTGCEVAKGRRSCAGTTSHRRGTGTQQAGARSRATARSARTRAGALWGHTRT